jgi:hypothetical protein
MMPRWNPTHRKVRDERDSGRVSTSFNRAQHEFRAWEIQRSLSDSDLDFRKIFAYNET